MPYLYCAPPKAGQETETGSEPSRRRKRPIQLTVNHVPRYFHPSGAFSANTDAFSKTHCRNSFNLSGLTLYLCMYYLEFLLLWAFFCKP